MTRARAQAGAGRRQGRAPRQRRSCAAWGWCVFLPEDLLLPRAAPSARRSFLDRAAYNVDRLFYAEAVAYQKVLRSRNAAAARGAPPARPCWTPTTSSWRRTGARLVMRRRAIVAALAPRVAGAVRGAARRHPRRHPVPQRPGHRRGQPARPRWPAPWRPAWGATGSSTCAGASPASAHTPTTWRSTSAGRPVREHGSQGQLRSLVLALKLAELGNLADSLGEPPLLLLDDVASELDEHPPAQAVRDHHRPARPDVHHGHRSRPHPDAARPARFPGQPGVDHRARDNAPSSASNGRFAFTPRDRDARYMEPLGF